MIGSETSSETCEAANTEVALRAIIDTCLDLMGSVALVQAAEALKQHDILDLLDESLPQ